MTYHDFAVELVRKAGAKLLEVRQGGVVVSHKKDDTRNLVTNLDIEISNFLAQEIKQAYPDHRVYSEEDANAAEAHMEGFEWVLDPIDGTANFSRGVPHFAVCAGLLKDGTPIAGAVFNPITRELFSFDVEQGAFLNGAPIRVSTRDDMAEAYAFVNIGHSKPLWNWGMAVYRNILKQCKKIKGFDSSSLDLCFVAAGRIEIVIYGTLSMRDIASAIGILRAAGGEVYSVRTGLPAEISEKPQVIAATNNKALFEKIKPLLRADLLQS